MDNVVSINHTKENVIEFEMTTDGVETKGMSVRFIIEAKGMELGFMCKKKKGDEWSVKLPDLPMLERTAYKFHVDVIADGYYFEPMKGTLNVTGTAELYTTTPKNKTLEPEGKKKAPAKKKAVKERVKTEPIRSNERSIESIAQSLMEQTKFDNPEQLTEKTEEKPSDNKDDKVIAILEEVGIKPKKKTTRKISFVKTRLLDS